MSEINTYSVTIKVEEENLAVSMGSGSLCVLATPCVVALMENAAAALADKVLDNDELTTVGTMISIEHTSPTPLGAEVTARFSSSTLIVTEYVFISLIKISFLIV